MRKIILFLLLLDFGRVSFAQLNGFYSDGNKESPTVYQFINDTACVITHETNSVKLSSYAKCTLDGENLTLLFDNPDGAGITIRELPVETGKVRWEIEALDAQSLQPAHSATVHLFHNGVQLNAVSLDQNGKGILHFAPGADSVAMECRYGSGGAAMKLMGHVSYQVQIRLLPDYFFKYPPKPEKIKIRLKGKKGFELLIGEEWVMFRKIRSPKSKSS